MATGLIPSLCKLGWICTLLSIGMYSPNANANIAPETEEVFVSLTGSDTNSGSHNHPFRTIEAAQLEARKLIAKGLQVTITVRKGVYDLTKRIYIRPEDSGLTLRAEPGQTVVLSGGMLLASAHWAPYKNGIYQTPVPEDFDTDQLYVNGEAQILARYPNYDPNAKYFNGTAADALSPERVKRWADPAGGYIHALHAYEWGDVHYRITGKDSAGNLSYEGGWQNNRQAGMRKDVVFVEGIFEELDSPSEWFLDRKSHVLYFYPPAGLDLNSAQVEGVRLTSLVEMHGTENAPIKNVTIEGFTFRQVVRTFMDNREPLLRSDWTIYRGGALHAVGTESCTVDSCFFDRVGGNAVFVDGYNAKFLLRHCRIENAGANGVAIVGNPASVRNALFEYNQRQSLGDLDQTPGPKENAYPRDCTIEDCLIDRIGRIEKQSAGVEISMSKSISVLHCSIYDMPRAGINIGDGCWGGHLIEGCDVFDTVKETGDHGSFNSWGRDRYWGLKDVDLNTLDENGLKKLPFLDAVDPITLRNNRWRCDHGWDIDLDDGSTNFRIVGNLCLNGGLKLREGFRRVCEDNVIVNNGFHIHVWFKDSHDEIRKNIVFKPYQVIQAPPPLGDACEDNLLHKPGMAISRHADALSALSGRDARSLEADAEFVDPAHGDYRVRPNSPALKLGFKNFAMDRFGVESADLKKIARTPEMPH